MVAVIQRVTESSVSVDGNIVGKIGNGLTVLLGVRQADTPAQGRTVWLPAYPYHPFPV
jgi:D-tyrosyl-tRNA(Tyr) deacylase